MVRIRRILRHYVRTALSRSIPVIRKTYAKWTKVLIDEFERMFRKVPPRKVLYRVMRNWLEYMRGVQPTRTRTFERWLRTEVGFRRPKKVYMWLLERWTRKYSQEIQHDLDRYIEAVDSIRDARRVMDNMEYYENQFIQALDVLIHASLKNYDTNKVSQLLDRIDLPESLKNFVKYMFSKYRREHKYVICFPEEIHRDVLETIKSIHPYAVVSIYVKAFGEIDEFFGSDFSTTRPAVEKRIVEHVRLMDITNETYNTIRGAVDYAYNHSGVRHVEVCVKVWAIGRG